MILWGEMEDIGRETKTADPGLEVRLVYAGLVSAALSIYLLSSALLAPTMDGSLSVAIVVFRLWVTTAVLVMGLQTLLRWITFGRLSYSSCLIAASFFVGSAYLTFRTHYLIFDQHLRGGALQQAWDGLGSGEVSLAGSVGIAGFAAVLGLFVGLSLLVLKGLGLAAERARPAMAGPARRLGWLAAATGLILLTGIGDWMIDTDSDSVRQLRAQIPWHPGVAGADVIGSSEQPSDEEGTADRVDQSVKQLLTDRPSILSSVEAQQTPNVVWIILETFRWDFMTDDIAPNLTALSRRCMSANRHYATGTDSSIAISGLAHGLSAEFYQPLRRGRIQPLPYEILDRLGYHMRFFHSASMAYSDTGARFFDHRFDEEIYTSDGDRVEREQELFRQLIETRQDRGPADDIPADDSPTFDLVWTYATHWRYYYPPSFERFVPVSSGSFSLESATGGQTLQRHMAGLKNRLRNASLFSDSLLGTFLDAFERSGGFEDTILIVVGDHGEAFHEHDRFGHTWTLHDEVSRTPFVICVPPGLEASDADQLLYQVSSHDDVFPTLFSMMELSVDSSRFMTGKALLPPATYDPQLDRALVAIPYPGADASARLVSPELTVHFNPEKRPRIREVLDSQDQTLEDYDAQAAADLVAELPHWQRLSTAGDVESSRSMSRRRLMADWSQDALLSEIHTLEDTLYRFLWLSNKRWELGRPESMVTPAVIVDRPWRFELYKESGKRRRTRDVSFLDDGRMGHQLNSEWLRWTINNGRLFGLDRFGEVLWVFHYSSREDVLIGASHREGQTAQGEVLPTSLRRRLPTELWSRGDDSDPPTVDSSVGKRLVICYDDDLNVEWMRRMTFTPEGQIVIHEGKASRSWEEWDIVQDRLIVWGRKKRMTASFYYDASQGIWASHGGREDFCTMKAEAVKTEDVKAEEQ